MEPVTPKKKKQTAALTPYPLAAEVARHVDLLNVYARALSTRMLVPQRTASEAMLRGGVDAQLSWNTSFETQDVPPSLLVAIAFKVALVPKGEQQVPVAEITAELALEYSLTSMPPVENRAELFEAFAKVNGVYNSWPYFREVVQNACSRMSLPPVVLPVYRVPKPTKDSTDSPDAKQ